MNSSSLVLTDVPETSPREPENIEHESPFSEGSLEIIKAEPNSTSSNIEMEGSHMKAVRQSRTEKIEGESTFQKTSDNISVVETVKSDNLNSLTR